MDIKHNYIECGKGPTMIFLHGNGEDYRYFANQISFFSKSFHVIAIDTRGQGKTNRGEKPFSIEQFAEDLYMFMEDKKIDKAIVIGFSDGANIAMELALRYQEKLTALVLNGGNLSPKGIRARYRVPMVLAYKMMKLFSRDSKKREKDLELLKIMVEEPNLHEESLSAIRVPTLVIAGTRDMIKRSETVSIARGIRGSHYVLIKGDHFIASKKHHEFNSAVWDFLDDLLHP